MEISLTDFLSQLVQYPALAVTTVLTLSVILVNGWTDAPNAIATCVSTRSLKPKAAILMAAVCNFFGLVFMSMINSKVAETIYNMVDFGGVASDALVGLCAALVAIVVWATAASYFGIPTSESHALIAGLSGSAIAMHNSLAGINFNEWIKVLYGLVFSTLLGFFAGFVVVKIIEFICKGLNRVKTNSFFKKSQIFGAAAMAFMHGAQDGQKFMGVFLLGMFLAKGQSNATAVTVPLWLMLLCAITMGSGSAIGGEKIIKSVGMDMVKLQPYQGFAADIVAAGCLLLSTLTGVPVSTTHTKTTAIMGVGAARNIKRVNWSIVKDMILAWVFTFPGCGLVGFLMAKLFILIF